jgi:hypothetical protein
MAGLGALSRSGTFWSFDGRREGAAVDVWGVGSVWIREEPSLTCGRDSDVLSLESEREAGTDASSSSESDVDESGSDVSG